MQYQLQQAHGGSWVRLIDPCETGCRANERLRGASYSIPDITMEGRHEWDGNCRNTHFCNLVDVCYMHIVRQIYFGYTS